MEPETNPTPGTPPQPETPNTDPQPQAPAPQPTETQPTPPANPEPASSAPVTPIDEWPGAFGIYKRVAAATKVNLGTILVFNILALVFSTMSRSKHSPLLVLIGILVSVWVQIALASLYLAGANGEKQELGDAARVGIKHYVDYFLCGIVVTVLLVLSLLAFIIPFFIVAPRLQFVLYYIIDKQLGPIDAIKASWADTKGHSLKVWGALGATLLFGVLCVLIVGIYFLFMYQSVFALLYLYINGKKAAAPSTPAVAPTAA